MKLRAVSNRAAVFVAVITGVVGLGHASAFAAAPANDDIASATTLTSSPVTGTNTEATGDSPFDVYKVCDNNGCHYGGKSVWYELPNPGTGWLSVSGVSLNTNFNAQLAVFEGPAGSVTDTSGISRDGANGQQFGTANTTDPVGFETSAGNDYFVVVDGYDNGVTVPSGNFTFTWSFTPAPANDKFVNASTLTTSVGSPSTSTSADTTGATLDANEPEIYGTEYDGSTSFFNSGAHSVWYKWVAPGTGQVTIDTHTSSFDTVLAAYTGSTLPTLTQVTTSDDTSVSDNTSQLTFTATSGQTYRIQLDGKDDGLGGAAFGAYTLHLSEVIAPANDAFAAATTITGPSGNTSGTNAGASMQSGEPQSFYFYECNYNTSDTNTPAGETVWYRWTAPSSGNFSFDTLSNGTFNTALAAYTGSAVTNLTEQTCNDDYSPSTLQSRMVINATGGQQYYIQVDGANDGTHPTSGAFTLTWHATPANDNFANAATISGSSGSTAGTNVGASVEFGEPQNAGVLNGASVWFNWTAPGNGTFYFKTHGSSFDTTLGIYTGSSVSALTEKASNNDVNGGDNSSYATLTATSGLTYHISVDGFQGASGSIALAWALVPPTNDDFANATTITDASGTAAGTNVGATAQAGEPAFLTGGKTVWWKWVAPGNSLYTFDTEGSSVDTLLGVYTGSAVNSLTVVGQNDDASGIDNKSKVSFEAASGTTYYFAVDGKSGTTGSLTLNWTVPPPDTTPPMIDSFTPANGAFVHGSAVSVTGDATDAGSGVQSMTFTIDDGSVIAPVVDTTAPYGFALNSTLLTDGPHTINVKATDTSNNTTPTALTHTFTVDNHAPPAPHFTAALGAFTAAASAKVVFTGTDPTSGISTYNVQYERANFNATTFGPWATPAAAGALTATSYTLTGLAPGYDYCFRVISRDRAGNVSAPSAVTCTSRLVDDKSAVHSAGWAQRAATGYYANTYSTTASAGRTLTLANFHGDRIGIEAVVCPTCGAIRIYVGTALVKTLSLVSATRKDMLISLPTFGNRSGTVKIVTASTKAVIIDAIGVSRT